MGKTRLETCELLMSVIRALQASESNEQRDKEKANLEKEYKKSDQRLNELIASNHEALTKTMQTFSTISARLAVARVKITSVRENVSTCKNLLNCKRDELKNLWLEGIEHKHVLYLLEQIETIKDVPVKINNHMEKKQFLHATKLLVSSIKELDSNLKDVEALTEVKTELEAKRMKLRDTILEELHKHLYVCSTDNVYGRRQGFYSKDSSPVHRYSKEIKLKSYVTETTDGGGHPTKTASVGNFTPVQKYKPQDPNNVASGVDLAMEIEEDLTAVDPEEDTAHYTAILVECLAVLDAIPYAVKAIQGRMEKELQDIVYRATQQIAREPLSDNLAAQKQPHILLELLELLFEQARSVVQAHAVVLGHLKRSVVNKQLDVPLYGTENVWSKIQAVLQVVLSDYLDIQNITGSEQQRASNYSGAMTDIASFFKKRPAAPKKMLLFKFDDSSTAMEFNTFLQDPKQGVPLDALGGGDIFVQPSEKNVVCTPDPQNITVIFKPLMKFVGEIEHTLGCLEGSHCALHNFLTEYVKDVFLPRIQETVANNVELANKSLDAWRINADLNLQTTLDANIPLLQSTVYIENCIQELWELMGHLPLYSDHFLNLICNTLVNYRETCQTAYKAVVQPETDEKRIISATWATDENISHFLRMLPNWKNLQQLIHNRPPDYEESHEEIQLRNLKESNMLTLNIREALVQPQEMLGDVALLRVLALLQESLEWFGDQVSKFANDLPSASSPQACTRLQDMAPVADNTIQTLLQVALDFKDLADKCLLILHLEVRVHCFYFLLPLTKQGTFASRIDSQDPVPEIVKMNKDLACIEEAMDSTLQPRKFKYMFEGLGQLIACILINGVLYIKRINENGIKKMCRNIFAVQQNLTNIMTSREVALDHARQYYEMLYKNPEEILNQIVDEGPQFSQLEYINAIQLLYRSQEQADIDPTQLNQHLARLQEIFNEVTTQNQ